jgi:sugar (pentulose or hexulose) kinase
MTTPRIIAVFDVGKTHAKAVIVDRVNRAELAIRVTSNDVVDSGPYPHHDTEALWRFFGDAVRDLSRDHSIDGFAVSAHGAGIILIDDEGLTLPMLDYEYDGPDSLSADYDAARADFSQTLSPRLPLGLNVGAQLFWLQKTFPREFARTRYIMTYPQYWAWRMTGLARNEITSLGSHSDLWNPHQRDWSALTKGQGWEAIMAPLQRGEEVHGVLLPELAEEWKVPKTTPVAGGLHDSNASLLLHLIDRKPPFTVISTGTWAITFGIGAKPEHMDERRDVLANIDVYGQPVHAARFMGGREFSLLIGDHEPRAGHAALEAVLARQIMALPAAVPESGPFQGLPSQWSHDADGLTGDERCCAASLYLALMSDTCLRLIGGNGPTIVDGPFASNPVYCRALATLTGRAVLTPKKVATGSSIGVSLLFELQSREVRSASAGTVEIPAFNGRAADALGLYADIWRRDSENRRARFVASG